MKMQVKTASLATLALGIVGLALTGTGALGSRNSVVRRTVSAQPPAAAATDAADRQAEDLRPGPQSESPVLCPRLENRPATAPSKAVRAIYAVADSSQGDAQAQGGTVYQYDSAGGRIIRLFHTTTGQGVGALAYLDPQHISFATGAAGALSQSSSIVVMDLTDGHCASALTVPGDIYDYSWSSDRTALAYTYMDPDQAHIHFALQRRDASLELALDPGPQGRDLISTDQLAARISPDGAHVAVADTYAWVKSGENLRVLRVFDASGRLELSSQADLGVNRFAWANVAGWDPSGRLIYIDGAIRSWDSATGNLSTLEAVTPRAASLSPDGRLLAHERYSSGASPRDLGGAVLDLATGQDRSLGDDTALPVFASSSTVWALEADPAQSGPFGNQETGRVISINLTSGSQSALPFPRYAGGFAFL